MTNQPNYVYSTPIGTFATYSDASDALVRVDMDPCEPGMIEPKRIDYTDAYWIDGHKLSNPVRVF